MQGREIFGALLRVLGIWFLVQACVNVIYIGLRLTHIMDALNNQITGEKIFAGFNLLLAVILLAKADKIAALFYGSAQ
jgi:hypothetical protein